MRIFTLFIMIAIPYITLAQEEGNWEVYLAQYEKGAGSTLLNMELKSIAPVKSHPYIVVTGVKFKDCGADGLPTEAEFPRLYKISDSVKKAFGKSSVIYAGTFTYQCERLDYYYLRDTIGVRTALLAIYNRYLAGYEPYISIKRDSEWEGYLYFLYPSDVVLNYMSDEKVVARLEKAGDKLEKERLVDHWISFGNEKDMYCFIRHCTANKFKIVSKKSDGKLGGRYKLQISRTDKVDFTSINAITTALLEEAKKCHGKYDGWETFVIK